MKKTILILAILAISFVSCKTSYREVSNYYSGGESYDYTPIENKSFYKDNTVSNLEESEAVGFYKGYEDQWYYSKTTPTEVNFLELVEDSAVITTKKVVYAVRPKANYSFKKAQKAIDKGPRDILIDDLRTNGFPQDFSVNGYSYYALGNKVIYLVEFYNCGAESTDDVIYVEALDDGYKVVNVEYVTRGLALNPERPIYQKVKGASCWEVKSANNTQYLTFKADFSENPLKEDTGFCIAITVEKPNSDGKYDSDTVTKTKKQLKKEAKAAEKAEKARIKQEKAEAKAAEKALLEEEKAAAKAQLEAEEAQLEQEKALQEAKDLETSKDLPVEENKPKEL